LLLNEGGTKNNLVKKNRSILLTFDVEEFDLPLEYGIDLSAKEQMQTGMKGLEIIKNLLSLNKISCTLFTTANFASQFPDEVRELAREHEIASHTFYHSSYRDEDLVNSRVSLEEIISNKIYGIRIPRMKKIDTSLIRLAGYEYDSSMHPTWIPGRYNNLHKPRSLYEENGIIELPPSVSPILRIPLFWLAFKNFPYGYYKNLVLGSLKKDGYVCLYFHPWEFADLTLFKLPLVIKRMSGEVLTNRLQKLITDLKEQGDFMTVHSFLSHNRVS
jgi:peptidoglycan/xylan/chitin deacetylase (PgdA/CDA1 family)